MLRPGLIASSGASSRLDAFHPVYNFLLEYYGFKGTKGCRRIARWSPPVMKTLLMCSNSSELYTKFRPWFVEACTVQDIRVSRGIEDLGNNGVLLENAEEVDTLQLIHTRGVTFVTIQTRPYEQSISGALYSPELYYRSRNSIPAEESLRGALEYYKSILEATLQAEPIFFCHGLHEWAMQYQPENHPPPPSSKYQSHLPLRVDQRTINAAVERRGVYCTHVDALRFFAPAARSWNHFGEYGTSVVRQDQPKLEQPACVHANMDLLKYAVRITPWIDGDVVADALDVALQARKLDIASSPYDVSMYGLNPIAVETAEGRKKYREMQADLLTVAQPLRQRIRNAYNDFLSQASTVQL